MSARPIPVTAALPWLRAEREAVHGSFATWREETRDAFYRDLGLIVDFLTSAHNQPATNQPTTTTHHVQGTPAPAPQG